jgi:RTX calcium-binding nonapeptide repeat (4 copies)
MPTGALAQSSRVLDTDRGELRACIANVLFEGSDGGDARTLASGGGTGLGYGGPDRLEGSSGRDCLSGGADDDVLDGGGGHDDLTGRSGSDALRGGDGSDQLAGGDGDDVLEGGADRDGLGGGPGDDVLRGGGGTDILIGSAGRNRYFGGAGADLIGSANGRAEDVDCGGGRDRVRADRRDRLRGCERVERVRRSPAPVLRATGAGGSAFAVTIRLPLPVRDVSGPVEDSARGYRLTPVGCDAAAYGDTSNEERVRQNFGVPATAVVHVLRRRVDAGACPAPQAFRVEYFDEDFGIDCETREAADARAPQRSVVEACPGVMPITELAVRLG